MAQRDPSLSSNPWDSSRPSSAMQQENDEEYVYSPHGHSFPCGTMFPDLPPFSSPEQKNHAIQTTRHDSSVVGPIPAAEVPTRLSPPNKRKRTLSAERQRSTTRAFEPTWVGHVETTMDALTVIEASLRGSLPHVPRRPHDKERDMVIQSGNVFLYEESISGIKRWTDGLTWSPSRIMQNFLVYRQLEKPFPPGQKKAAKRRRTSEDQNSESNKQQRRSSDTVAKSQSSPDAVAADRPRGYVGTLTAEQQRKVVGSLIDSYPFKEGGLMKKTLSVRYRGSAHHLVYYYSVEDVIVKKFKRPCELDWMKDIKPRKELYEDQNFRASIHDKEDTTNASPGLFHSSHLLTQSSMDGYQNTHGIPLQASPAHPQVSWEYSARTPSDPPTPRGPINFCATTQQMSSVARQPNEIDQWAQSLYQLYQPGYNAGLTSPVPRNDEEFVGCYGLAASLPHIRLQHQYHIPGTPARPDRETTLPVRSAMVTAGPSPRTSIVPVIPRHTEGWNASPFDAADSGNRFQRTFSHIHPLSPTEQLHPTGPFNHWSMDSDSLGMQQTEEGQYAMLLAPGNTDLNDLPVTFPGFQQ